MTIEEAVDRALPVVSNAYGVTREELMGKGRNYNLAEARFALWKLLRAMPDCERGGKSFTFTKIGGTFGRDHGTIRHGCQRLEEWVKVDRYICRRYESVKSKIETFDEGGGI